MRILGLLLLMLCGGLWGLYRAYALAERARMLLALRQLVERFRTGIASAAPPLEQLLRQDHSCPFCALALGDPDFPDRPRLALEHACLALLANREDRSLAQGLVSGLGASDREGQLKHLALYAGLLEESAARARREREEKARLYLCLGLCAGTGLGLLLL